MKKWRCLVCNYIHIGDNPPDVCPVCGAPRDDFVLVEEAGPDKLVKKEVIDRQVDFLIVGSGAAGLTAAVRASYRGLKPLVIEKAPVLGGTTARSGARYWIPNNYAQKALGIEDSKEDCLRYMARYSYPNTYNKDKDFYGLPKNNYELMEAYYDTGSQVVDFFREIGLMESSMQYSWKGRPQLDYMDSLGENKHIRGRTLMPKTDQGEGVRGLDLINLMLDWLADRQVEIEKNARAVRILMEDGRAIGLQVEKAKTLENIYSKQGIFFASGGFSHNRELLNNFHNMPPYGGCASGANTGDLIPMAQEVGASLANMNNAYRTQTLYEAYLDNPQGVNSVFYIVGDSIIQVNKYGRRVVNEKRNYNDRSQIHSLWDPVKGEFPNRFLFLIMDGRTARNWNGMPPIVGPSPDKMPYVIQGRDLDQLAENIAGRLEALGGAANNFRLDPSFRSNLEATIRDFNSSYETGQDLDFKRGDNPYDREFFTFPPLAPQGIEWPPKDSKNPSIYPLDSGPYYAFILAPGCLDTNGGPLINKDGQILDFASKPIENLYGSGNCIASPGRAAYWGAGATIGTAMIFAYRAVDKILE